MRNKALMVKRVIETHHMSDDVYVFGDGYNDMSLFKAISIHEL